MTVSNKSQWWLVAGFLAATFVLLFGFMPYATGYGNDRKPIAYWLWYFWRFPEWQHGALVPFIAAGLIWWKRDTLKSVPIKGSSAGIGICVLALFLYFVGHRGNLYYFGYASCQLLLAGMVLWILGWKYFRKLLFVWCFLAFMWPLFFLETRLGFPLRMLMTDLSSTVLNLAQVDHLKLGSAIISAPNASAGLARGDLFALEVANPCSGIRSLFALIMMGALYGYVSLKREFDWIILTLAAIPLAVAGNVVRILLLLGGCRVFGSDFAVGKDGATSTFHFLAGVAVFLTAAAGMVILAKFLNRRNRNPQNGLFETKSQVPLPSES